MLLGESNMNVVFQKLLCVGRVCFSLWYRSGHGRRVCPFSACRGRCWSGTQSPAPKLLSKGGAAWGSFLGKQRFLLWGGGEECLRMG